MALDLTNPSMTFRYEVKPPGLCTMLLLKFTNSASFGRYRLLKHTTKLLRFWGNGFIDQRALISQHVWIVRNTRHAVTSLEKMQFCWSDLEQSKCWVIKRCRLFIDALRIGNFEVELMVLSTNQNISFEKDRCLDR
ncbi:unnamed protein product [Phytophthora fragariaefolia]|uniref:Unnamed protein product n=1 Tax=Phytophthora fragariaefolia TaxID=1490495 RepID=A0A9W7D1V6_9STRA|nr:unnamed protein product [Phytophthora fragariaefolia]